MRQTMANAVFIGGLAVCSAASAQTVLDFEGLQNLEPIQEFYNGGAGGLGSTSTLNAGVSFPGNTLAIIDADAGGSGSFANEPSPDTIMFFQSPASSALMNIPAGFTGGFSFSYSSSVATNVLVYDGLNATGNVLATIPIQAQHSDNCTGDPSGTFCNWSPAGATFVGTARSIDFGGTADQTGYDDITLGSATPGVTATPMPVPATTPGALLLLAAGLAAVVARARRTGPHKA